MPIKQYSINRAIPKYPGICKPLSKQGLDAIIGMKVNKIAGKYWNKAEWESTFTINGWANWWNIKRTIIVTSNQPRKLKKGTP